jgi:rubrerythrin
MGDTLNSAIALAIDKEKEAYDFYMDLYKLVEDKEAKSTLKYIAQEEAKHREFLENCQEGRFCSEVLKLETPVDYKIVEHMKKPDIQKNMKSVDVYLVAAALGGGNNDFERPSP